jgi:purine-binding chemotaxis protein CheW
MNPATQSEDRAAMLRAAFDRAFSAAPVVANETGERLLLIGVGGDRLLLRLRDIGGLFADRRIVAVPRANPALLGITGLRGAILPVYGLGVALGYPPADGAPRWLVTATAVPLAFAFEHFDRHVEIARDRIVPRADDRGGRGHLREAATVGSDTLSIVDLPSVAAQL